MNLKLVLQWKHCEDDIETTSDWFKSWNNILPCWGSGRHFWDTHDQSVPIYILKNSQQVVKFSRTRLRYVKCKYLIYYHKTQVSNMDWCPPEGGAVDLIRSKALHKALFTKKIGCFEKLQHHYDLLCDSNRISKNRPLFFWCLTWANFRNNMINHNYVLTQLFLTLWLRIYFDAPVVKILQYKHDLFYRHTIRFNTNMICSTDTQYITILSWSLRTICTKY